jgi:hypothetical protein
MRGKREWWIAFVVENILIIRVFERHATSVQRGS